MRVDYEESWALRNWCFWTVVLEKTLRVPWTARRSNQSILKGNQSWMFIGRTDEAETPVLWPPDAKSWLIGKDPDAGKDWRQEKKGTTEDEMVGRHHWLHGREFEQTLGVDGEGQGILVWCNALGHNESDMTEWLNWNKDKLLERIFPRCQKMCVFRYVPSSCVALGKLPHVLGT